MIELTLKCKVAFIDWYKEFEPKSDWKYPALVYFDRHDINYKIMILTEFFDSNDIHIKIEPHIGGGALVFYPSVKFRNAKWIDCENECNDYFSTREEASIKALSMCDFIFNEERNYQSTVINRVELDDLPF